MFLVHGIYGIGQNVTVKRTDTRTGEVEEITRPMSWVERTDVELPRHFRKYAKAKKAGKKWEDKRRSIGRWGPSPKEKARGYTILSFHTTSHHRWCYIPYYTIPDILFIPYHTARCRMYIIYQIMYYIDFHTISYMVLYIIYIIPCMLIHIIYTMPYVIFHTTLYMIFHTIPWMIL